MTKISLNNIWQLLKIFGFNVLFDALGGGDIAKRSLINLNRNSQVFLYGKL